MVKVGINGFGRIGRLAFRIGVTKHSDELTFSAINTSGSMPPSGWAQLVNFDTMYRKFEYEVKSDETSISIPERGISVPILAEKDPGLIPWGKYGVEVVIEATGKFTSEEDAKKHALGGAKRVVISAPAKGDNVGTYVIGVNETSKDAVILSNASCTTNCVAPVAAVMHAKFGIEKAMMTTVHSYTDDQNLQDGSHKDLRRARAAACNIVPTTTGAAIATMTSMIILGLIFAFQSWKILGIVPLRRKMINITIVALIPTGLLLLIKQIIEINLFTLIILGILFISLYVLLIMLTRCLDKKNS